MLKNDSNFQSSSSSLSSDDDYTQSLNIDNIFNMTMIMDRQQHSTFVTTLKPSISSVSSASSSTDSSMIIITNEVNEAAVIIAYSLIVIISLIGNSLVVKIAFSGRWIPGRSQRARTTTDVLIGSLSFSDLVMTIFNIPFNLARILLPYWPFGRLLCYGVPFVQTACVYVSTFTMAAIALHRWRMVSHPTTVMLNKTNRSISSSTNPLRSFNSLRRTITIVWLISFGLAAPTVAFNQLKLANVNGQYVIRCRVDYPFIFGINASLLLTIEIFLTQYLIPLLITGVLYMKIATVIHRQSRFNQITNTNVNKYNDKNDDNVMTTNHKGRNSHDFHHLKSLSSQIDLASITNHHVKNQKQQQQQNSAAISSGEMLSTQTIMNDDDDDNVVVVDRLKQQQQQQQQRQQQNSQQQSSTTTIITRIGKRRRQLEVKRRRILMLSLVVAVFAICWLPLNLYHLTIDLGFAQHRLTVFLVCHWFAMSSVCYNSFIYCWLNESFRQNAIELLRKIMFDLIKFQHNFLQLLNCYKQQQQQNDQQIDQQQQQNRQQQTEQQQQQQSEKQQNDGSGNGNNGSSSSGGGVSKKQRKKEREKYLNKRNKLAGILFTESSTTTTTTTSALIAGSYPLNISGMISTPSPPPPPPTTAATLSTGVNPNNEKLLTNGGCNVKINLDNSNLQQQQQSSSSLIMMGKKPTKRKSKKYRRYFESVEEEDI
uniref:Neuropeptide Y receptor type 5-like n=1 Tax=Dermatophagoides pteronyssinus TaxID=6956 RepID=A0A6P6XUG0_DERPT